MAQYDVQSEQETELIAAKLADGAKNGDVFLLSGTLGSGKSVFARAFIRSLCGEHIEVPSPTFTLVQLYEHPRAMLWHFDLYRLKSSDEIFEIGWEDAISSGIVLVEWPERLGLHKPKNGRAIHIKILDADKRSISIDD